MHAIRIDRAKPLAAEPNTGHNRYHPDIAPILEVGEGEDVSLDTRDGVDGQIGPVQAGILKTTAPLISNDVDFFHGISLKWGFGHMINMQPVPEARSAGSMTWAGLYNTYYWIDPKKRVAAVFMTQVLPFADERALHVYRQFERGIYAAVKTG